MSFVTFYCPKCENPTQHSIVRSSHDGPTHNYSTIKCIHCPSQEFVVEYDKNNTEPDYWSKKSAIGSNQENEPLNLYAV